MATDSQLFITDRCPVVNTVRPDADAPHADGQVTSVVVVAPAAGWY